DDLPRVIEARAKSIETGRIYEVEHRCRRADGVYRWFQVRGVPVRNAEGAITAWYLLLTDINDLKRAEEALQSSERNLGLTINTIPICHGQVQKDSTWAKALHKPQGLRCNCNYWARMKFLRTTAICQMRRSGSSNPSESKRSQNGNLPHSITRRA